MFSGNYTLSIKRLTNTHVYVSYVFVCLFGMVDSNEKSNCLQEYKCLLCFYYGS